MRRTFPAVCISLLIVAAASGCGGPEGSKLAPFTGKVTYKGRPIANATITIQPEEGAIGSAITDTEGNFVAKTGRYDGVAIGKCTIVVEAWVGGSSGSSEAPTLSESAAKDNPNATGEMMKKAMENMKKGKPKSLIPIKYTKSETTPLKNVEIPSSGTEDYEIKLTD